MQASHQIKTWALFQYIVFFSGYGDSSDKAKTVSWLFYLYHAGPYTG